MKPLVVEKAQAGSWLRKLCQEFDVFGPVETKKGFYNWKRLDGTIVPHIPQGVAKVSIKTFFFPQPEVMFEFDARPTDPEAFRPIEPHCDFNPRVLFGVRPCDARSVALNAMPYREDPYFQRKRKETTIVAFLCEEGCLTCFCTLTGGSPVGIEGADMAVTELETGFFLEPVTEKGLRLLDYEFFRKPTAQEKSIAQERKKGAQKSVEDTASKLRSKDLMDLYNAHFWAAVAESCINCGACTFLCPTCYCFDIQDEALRGKGRRIRYWDSCMFPLFTQHASGHNPRGEKLKRVRNRFMHKLKYFPDRFGPISCVGCGRCVRDCPVNIDIRQVMEGLMEV